MKKIKNLKIRILILLVLSIFLISCTSSGSGGPSNLEVNYNKGNEGLKLEFLKDLPPEEVLEDNNFGMLVGIQNNGAYDIAGSSYAILKMSVDKFYLEEAVIDDRSENIQLLGRSKNNPNGDFQIYEFEFYAKPLHGQRISPDTRIITTLCYPYITKLVEDYCLDSDYLGLDEREKVCEISNFEGSEGQGGPVSVKNVEARYFRTGDQPSLDLLVEVENMGDGQVIAWDPESPKTLEDTCFLPDPEFKSVSTLNVEGNLGGVELECNNPIKLRNGKGVTKCKTTNFLFINQRNFLSKLNINLLYVYKESRGNQIEIIRNS